MPAPIRLLHFADLHIGMENYGKLDPATGTSSRVRDFLDRLDEVVDYALSHQADLVVFAGDAFKTRDPEPTQQREFARRMKRLADHIPTLLLVGNHDMPGSTQKATSVDIFRALDVPNVIVGHTPDAQVVETAHGPVFLAWVPYPTRNRLLSDEEHRGKSIEELDRALRTALITFVEDLEQRARAAPMPRVLAGHFSVAEAHYGSERSVMLGRDVAVPRSVLAQSAWDYVALGHIHKHQVLTAHEPGLPPVVYSGSLERIDFGEEREAKGFCWVTVERGATQFEFVEVHARPFQTLRVDVRDRPHPAEAIQEALRVFPPPPGAVVRVIVTLNHDQLPLLDEREVTRALASASHVTLEKQIVTPVRARLGAEVAESLGPRELLQQYLRLKGTAEDRIAQLLELADPILSPGRGEPLS